MTSNTEQAETKQNAISDPSSTLMVKLKHILDNVTSQENILQNKTSKIEKWYNIHKSALENASNVKKKLIEFEPIKEDIDNEQVKDRKIEHKTAINMGLDSLSNELNLLYQCESQYRSTECINELTEKTEIIHKMKNKHSILMTHNKSLLKQNANYEEKIKLLSQQHDILMETTKKELVDRHTDYVQNLQFQHEAQLKYAQTQHENELKYEIANELNPLKQEIQQKEELLAKYVALDKGHQELSTQWNEQKKQMNADILEMKQSEMKTTEKLLQLNNENNALQRNAVKHSLSVIKQSQQIDKLNLEILERKTLHETQQKRLHEMHKKNKQMKHEKCALIKEVKRLRQSVVEKDEKKSEILSKMSQNEIEHKEIVDSLKKEYCNVMHRFKTLICVLTDCNSHIENFSDTINNFSYKGLMESYETEYEARCKSTELLNDAVIGNISDEIIKIHSQMNVNKIKDEIKEIQSEETQLKSLFDESDIQISYIRVALLKLLMEYVESIKECNDTFIKYNYNNEEEDNDGVYNYVSSGVSAVANLVNPFQWNNQNDFDSIDINKVKDAKNKSIPLMSDDMDKDMDNDTENDIDNDIYNDMDNDMDSISTHYLAKSAFLSVKDPIDVRPLVVSDAIEVNEVNETNDNI